MAVANDDGTFAKDDINNGAPPTDTNNETLFTTPEAPKLTVVVDFDALETGVNSV